MRNLFVVYGDILSDKLLYLADVIVIPAYGGSMKPQDELTERFFELSGKQQLERAIAEKYGSEPMQHGEVRKIIGGELIEATLFVNSADTPLWSLEKEPEIEKRIIIGYHNTVTVASVLGYKSILLPNFGASLSDEENQKMIRRINQLLIRLTNRRNIDIFFVLSEYLA